MCWRLRYQVNTFTKEAGSVASTKTLVKLEQATEVTMRGIAVYTCIKSGQFCSYAWLKLMINLLLYMGGTWGSMFNEWWLQEE